MKKSLLETHTERAPRLPPSLKRSARLAPVCALCLVGWAQSGCQKSPLQSEKAAPRASTSVDVQALKTPSVEELKDSPEVYAGKRLVLAGEVDEVLSLQSFKLKDAGDWLFADELLVLTRQPVSFGGLGLRKSDDIVVYGTVRKFVVFDIEQEIGLDFDPQLELEWQDKWVFVADSIRRFQEYSRWSESEEQDGIPIGLVSVLLEPKPQTLAGQTLELRGVPILDKMNEGIWVGYSHRNELFVVASRQELAMVEQGDWVDVKGTLKAMPPATEAVARWSMDETLSARVAREALFLEASELELTEIDTR